MIEGVSLSGKNKREEEIMCVLTKDLALKFEKAEIDSLTSRLTAVQSSKGNPMCVNIRDFGGARAFSVKHIPGPAFNTVKGLSKEAIPFLNQILDFFKEKEIPCRIELTPTHASSEVYTSLTERGFYQSGFHTLLYGSTKANYAAVSETIMIRELEDHEFDRFGDIYVRGFGMPSFLKEDITRNNQVLYGLPNWRFLGAMVEGELVGVAVLYTNGECADLAAAATVPEARNRGVQSALLAERFKLAGSLGCDYIIGQAQFGSASQRNMQRAGMNIAYTKAIWVQR